MGRQTYLSRLALGRSAFEQQTGVQAEEVPAASHTGHNGAQHYDSKGRPINPQTEAFNAEMRKAQNEVLELVGVVERKDRATTTDAWVYARIKGARQDVLKAENNLGEVLAFVFPSLRYLSSMWIESFRQRIQIGFYDLRQPLTAIIIQEWTSMFQGLTKGRCASLFPGIASVTLLFLIRALLGFAMGYSDRLLDEQVTMAFSRRKSRKAMLRAVSLLDHAIQLLIDTALFPLVTHSYAQKLGLIPSTPTLPPLNTLWTASPSSFDQVDWQRGQGPSLISSFTSPVGLWLLGKYLRCGWYTRQSAACRSMTSFRYPAINHRPKLPKPPPPPPLSDPIGWIAHQSWALRTRLLHLAGWKLVLSDRHLAPGLTLEGNEPEDGATATATANSPQPGPHSPEPPTPRHRSTALAQLPAESLAYALDSLFARILTLPWDSLVVRSLAAGVLLAPQSMTARGVAAAPQLYRPFGGGPWGGVWRAPGSAAAWGELGRYANALGLALALASAWDTVLFAGVYGVTRTMGVRWFDWGRRGKIGSLQYGNAEDST